MMTYKEKMETIKKAINDYSLKEFDSDGDFSNMDKIPLLYTTDESGNHEIQAYYNSTYGRIYVYNGSDDNATLKRVVSCPYYDLDCYLDFDFLLEKCDYTIKENYEQKALHEAEIRGVYSYMVRGSKMVYYSYFGIDGIYKVTIELDTLTETRKHQSTTKFEYNYFCG